MATAEELAGIRARMDAACEAEDRDPATLPLSLMTGWIVGSDEADLLDRAGRLAEWQGESGDPQAFIDAQQESWIIGTAAEAIERARALEAVGVQRIMAQHLLHRDLDAITLLGSEVIPALAR